MCIPQTSAPERWKASRKAECVKFEVAELGLKKIYYKVDALFALFVCQLGILGPPCPGMKNILFYCNGTEC